MPLMVAWTCSAVAEPRLVTIKCLQLRCLPARTTNVERARTA
jgi:hypothetical protein